MNNWERRLSGKPHWSTSKVCWLQSDWERRLRSSPKPIQCLLMKCTTIWLMQNIWSVNSPHLIRWVRWRQVTVLARLHSLNKYQEQLQLWQQRILILQLSQESNSINCFPLIMNSYNNRMWHFYRECLHLLIGMSNGSINCIIILHLKIIKCLM